MIHVNSICLALCKVFFFKWNNFDLIFCRINNNSNILVYQQFGTMFQWKCYFKGTAAWVHHESFRPCLSCLYRFFKIGGTIKYKFKRLISKIHCLALLYKFLWWSSMSPLGVSCPSLRTIALFFAIMYAPLRINFLNCLFLVFNEKKI